MRIGIKKLGSLLPSFLYKNIYTEAVILLKLYLVLLISITEIAIGIAAELPTVGASTGLCILGSIGMSVGLIGLFSGIYRLTHGVEKETRKLVKAIKPKVS